MVTEYGPGDVVTVMTENSEHLPKGTRANFVRREGGVCWVEQQGFKFLVLHTDIQLYRRHIDSPHRAADNKRFWKLKPPPKRAKGAK